MGRGFFKTRSFVKEKISFLFLLIFCIFSPKIAQAADRYWVGFGGDFSDSSNWSATDGGISGASVPGASDDVYFTATTNTNCNWDTSATVASINLQSGYTSTVLTASSVSITVNGNATFTDGTFQMGSSSSITFNTAFLVNGGTFDARRATMRNNYSNDASFTVSGGTFHAPDKNLGTGDYYLMGGFNVTGGSVTTSNADLILDYWSAYFHASATFATFTQSNTMQSGFITFLGIAGGKVVTITGQATFNTGFLSGFGALELQGPATFNVGWAGENNGASISFSSATAQTITLPSYSNYYPVFALNSASTTLIGSGSGTLLLRSDNVLTAGTINLNGSNLTLQDGNGTLTLGSGMTFIFEGDETISMFGNPTLNSGSTVQYTGTDPSYTLRNWSYSNLSILGGASSTFNLAANTTLQDLTIQDSTLSLATFDLTVNGDFSNEGTLLLKGDENLFFANGMDTDSGTVEYADTASHTGLAAGDEYYHLTFDGTGGGSWSLIANLTVNGNLTLEAGALNAGNENIEVQGDWSNTAGTFTSTGTVSLTGGNQVINGNTTFYNLSKTVSSALTLSFAASSTTTVSNTLTLQGASGNLLSLRSNSTGTRWNLIPQGTLSIQYLNVRDSNNTGNSALCLTGCVDAGNNVGWYFEAGVPVTGSPMSLIEGGASGTYSVVLASPPNAPVTINISPDSGVDTDLTSLTFLPANWYTPQIVTVSIPDDPLHQGDRTSYIAQTASSADSFYNGISVDSVTVNITDDDTPGVTLSKSTLTIQVGSTPGTYTVVLNTQPSADVTITPSSSNTDLSISPSTLTFTNANWNTPQTVTVSASNSLSTSITHTASSADPEYDGISINSVSVTSTGESAISLKVSGPTSTVAVGENANYLITASNSGTGSEENFKVLVSLPANLEFVSGTISQPFSLSVTTESANNCTANSQLVTCDIGTLNNGFGVSVNLVTKVIQAGTFSIEVIAEGSSEITSTATVSTTAEGGENNNDLTGGCSLSLATSRNYLGASLLLLSTIFLLQWRFREKMIAVRTKNRIHEK